MTLKVGTIIDRYGSPFGNFTSPVKTSFEERSVPGKEPEPFRRRSFTGRASQLGRLPSVLPHVQVVGLACTASCEIAVGIRVPGG
ncbi:MAG: glycohydrolase toxin TNT-related protein [Planctomycetia bacterium]|nr:glycohydrolase toxin TNT-related protein [Planctomycetia bacterium]